MGNFFTNSDIFYCLININRQFRFSQQIFVCSIGHMILRLKKRRFVAAGGLKSVDCAKNPMGKYSVLPDCFPGIENADAASAKEKVYLKNCCQPRVDRQKE